MSLEEELAVISFEVSKDDEAADEGTKEDPFES